VSSMAATVASAVGAGPARGRGGLMDYKLGLIVLPVVDVDAAKDFYVDRAGFAADYDTAPNEHYRIVQLTRPGHRRPSRSGRT